MNAAMRPASIARPSFPSMSTLALAALLGVGTGSPPSVRAQTAAAPDDRPVVIYRCTDAKGRLSLRDSPCRPGERQDVRHMVRPKDATVGRATPHDAIPARTAAAAPQVVVLRTPQPLYECAGPEHRYLSDTPEGRLRWVPNPYAFAPAQTPLYDPSYGFVHVGQDGLYAGYGNAGPSHRPPAHPHRPYVVDNGAWVRDTCRALPQADACARLREERGTLGRRRFNAQQSERIEIDREERRVDARIAQDCG